LKEVRQLFVTDIGDRFLRKVVAEIDFTVRHPSWPDINPFLTGSVYISMQITIAKGDFTHVTSPSELSEMFYMQMIL